jgi:hypothetical protein
MYHGNIVYFNEMVSVAIDQSQLNICVAIPPIATMLAVAKQSIAIVSVRCN